jgi:PKD repeat protein
MKKILFILGLVFTSNLHSQSLINSFNLVEECKTEQKHKQLYLTDPIYRANFDASQLKITEIINSGVRTGGVYTIPVVVHVIHLGSSEGSNENISDAQIQSAIDNLNDAYANNGYAGLDIEIQFELAKRDPNCQSTDGILRVNGSGVTGGGDNYSTVGITDNNEETIKALSKWPNGEYYNIWIVTEIDDNGGGSGTQGYAYYPGGSSDLDGAVILYNSFGYDPTLSLGYNLKSYTNYNVTAIHELGHGLNLFHTFQGDGTGSTCPANVTCSTDGDQCCDTDAHKRDDGSNCNISLTTCYGVAGSPVFNNFMAYSQDDCQDRFTADQKTRMRAAMEGPRLSLLNSLGDEPVSGVQPSVSQSCQPQTTTLPNGFGIGIFSFTLGNLTVGSGDSDSDGGYIEKWCANTTLDVSTQYNVEVINNVGQNNEDVKVYIDYNNDGDFDDAGENIFSSNANTTHSGTFTTPASPVTGTPIWVRVISDFYGNNISGPCYTPQYGQAEDYSITINSGSPSAPVANFSANSTSVCQGATVIFTDASSDANSWSWNFGSGASPSTATGQGPHSVTYSTSGNKTISLDVSGPGGNDNDTKTNYVTVNSTVTPSVSIASNDADNTICSGTNVQFTASPVNGGTPSYQWKLNGGNVGSNSANYSNSSLTDNDQVICVITSTALCASPTTATSNTITMNVTPSVTPAISISASANPINSGDPVNFTAMCITNCGSSQSYQWKLNGGNVGTNSTSYSNSTLANGDQVSCVISTNATCATTGTSNTITMTVNSGSCSNTVYGPGGVGNSANNKIWLDASMLNLTNGNAVTNWLDKSGNNLTAASQYTSSRPIFKTNQINGFPSLDFDGINDHLRITNLTSVSTMGQTWFIVGNFNTHTKSQALLHIGATTGSSYQKNLRYTLYYVNNNKSFSSHLNSSGSGSGGALHTLSLATEIYETSFTPTSVTGFTNGNQTGSFTSASLVTPAANQMMNIGRRGNLNDYFLDGNVAEVIVYNYTLNTTERILVENYLGSKYNRAIANDFYSLEATGHFYEVTGIGMQGGISVTDAEGGSGVQINTPSAIINGDYLLWGHNNASNTVTTAGAPSAYGGTGKILSRNWRADKTNDVGTVTVMFHLDGILSGTSDYELLIDSDGNFSNATRITSGYSYDNNCDIASWTGINFSDGDYFTIGNPDGTAMMIEPIFVSEDNSTNNLDFDESENTIALSVIDNITESIQMTVYPNPSSGLLFIENLIEGASIEIYNTLGQIVFHNAILQGKNQFDFSAFNNGLYFIHLKDINHETIAVTQLMLAK